MQLANKKVSQKKINNQSTRRKITANVYKYYLFHFLWGINTFVSVMVPFFTVWGNISFFQIMALQSYFTFVLFILEIPSGAIADFFGNKRALSLAAIVLIIAAICYSTIPNLILFFIAETLWAFGTALFSGTDQAFLYNTLKILGKDEDMSKYTARSTTLFLIASLVSAPLGSFFAVYISLQFTMFFLTFTYLGAFLVTLTFKEPVMNNNHDDHVEKEKYLKITIDGFKQLKENKILRSLCYRKIFIQVLLLSLFWVYQPYLIQINVSLLLFGFIRSMFSITHITFTNILPVISKKVKKKAKFLMLVELLCGISFIVLGFTTHSVIGIILLLIIVAFGNPRPLLFINGINRHIDSENRATVLSTLNMFRSILSSIFYLIIGIVVTWNISAIFFILGISIITLTLTLRVKSEYL